LPGVGTTVGCTVALFITELALTDPVEQSNAKLAIFVASVVAAALSIAILWHRAPTTVLIDTAAIDTAVIARYHERNELR
jgi:Na+/H+ antiporter NhaA